MNRETKLALIIGFAFILVVGVLISDHLSAVQHAELADVTRGAGEADAGPPPPDPLAPVESPAPGDDSPDRAGGEQARRDRARDAGDSPGARDEGGWRPGALAGRIGGPNQSANRGRADAARTPPPLMIRQGVAASDEGSGRPDGDGSSRDGDGEREADPDPVAAPMREPEPTTYRVRSGDTLYSIAQQEYGDGTLWRRIRDANREAVGADGGLIRAGQRLTIPPKRGEVRDARAQQGEADGDASGGSPRSYTVKPGDRLEGIALRLLGSRDRVEEIVGLNEGTIEDPDRIRVGMTLRIPAR